MAKSKRGRKKGSSARAAGEQLGFVAEGIRAVLTWLAALVMALWSFLVWTAERAWEALQGDRARQPLGLVLAAASTFVFVALLDYRAGAPELNVCGSLGYRIADALLTAFGIGAFLAPAFGIFWGAARVVREASGHAAVKLLGVAILSGAVSVAAAGWDPEGQPHPSLPTGKGGWLGTQSFPLLLEGLGAFGVAVLLALIAVLAFLLATEWGFVPLVRDLARKSRESISQPELPLEAPQKAAKEILEEAGRNRDRAARGLSRVWQGFLGLLRPFHPGEAHAGAESLATAAAGAGIAGNSSIPMTVSGRGGAATLERPASRTKTRPAPVAEPEEEQDEEWEEGEWEEEEWDEEEEDPEAEYEEYDEDEEYEDEEGEEEDEYDEEEDEESEEIGSLPGISDGPEIGHERDRSEPAARPKRRRRQPTFGPLPPTSILRSGTRRDRSVMQAEIDALGQRLQATFDAFGLDARVVGAERGPTLTLFEVQLASGVSVKKLKNQRDDMAVQLGSHGVRIVYPLPGRTTVGIEVPNLQRENVYLKNVFEESDLVWEHNKLPTVLGRDTLGKPAVEDLTSMPHMLIAGTTGSGKSVCVNSILMSMLLTRSPEQLRLVLIDPKQVELQLYRDIPHLLCPVVTDMKRAPFTLEWATRQMEDRLHMFKMAGVRNIGDYNELSQAELKRRVGSDAYDPDEFPDTIPYIVLVIDELADLMMVSAKEVEIAISRLAAKARAAGIHLLVATQRPSTDVVTGLIKMNLPVRIAFKVTSAVDSRVILDDSGADLLLGNGDFLYRPPGASGMVRGQGAFVSEKEVREVCHHLRSNGKPEFLEELVQMKGATAADGAVDDPLFDDAVRIILQSGRGSASLLQRALSVGYTRASRLIDIMTEQGVLGPFVGSKSREVLVTVEEWDERQKQPR